MNKEQKVKDFLTLAGYNMSGNEFEKAFGYKVSINTSSWDSGIHIQNTDPFHKSYAKPSKVSMGKDTVDKGNFTQEHVKKFKSRIKAKDKQVSLLEEIRSEAIREKIPQFISEHFGINKELITPEEISFTSYSQFEVAGTKFSYTGTIQDRYFGINTIPGYYRSYKEVFEKVQKIHHHFCDRQEGLLRPLNLSNSTPNNTVRQ